MKNNKYDYFIILLISSLSLGMLFQLIKIIGIIFFPYSIIKTAKNNKWFFIYFILLILYVLIHSIFSSDIHKCIDEFISLISLVGSFNLLIEFAQKANNPYKSVIYGWLVSFILTFPFAIYEISTGTHHYTSLLNNAQYETKHYASIFFGNMNRYSLFLCCCLPFLISFLYLCKHSYEKVLFFLSVIVLCYLILHNASRGAFIVLLITLLVVIYFNFKISPKYNAILIILILLSAYFLVDTTIIEFNERLKNKGGFYDASRISLYLVSIYIFVDSLGFGVGLGSLESEFQNYSQIVGDLRIPHNLFLEYLVIFGIVFTILFIIMLCKLYCRGLKSKYSHIKILFIISITTLLPMSIINSNYVLNPVIWIYFASLYIVSFKFKISYERYIR